MPFRLRLVQPERVQGCQVREPGAREQQRLPGQASVTRDARGLNVVVDRRLQTNDTRRLIHRLKNKQTHTHKRDEKKTKPKRAYRVHSAPSNKKKRSFAKDISDRNRCENAAYEGRLTWSLRRVVTMKGEVSVSPSS